MKRCHGRSLVIDGAAKCQRNQGGKRDPQAFGLRQPQLHSGGLISPVPLRFDHLSQFLRKGAFGNQRVGHSLRGGATQIDSQFEKRRWHPRASLGTLVRWPKLRNRMDAILRWGIFSAQICQVVS